MTGMETATLALPWVFVCWFAVAFMRYDRRVDEEGKCSRP